MAARDGTAAAACVAPEAEALLRRAKASRDNAEADYNRMESLYQKQLVAQQAMMAMSFFFMPAMLISGYLFPIANMPTVIQYLSLLNPLRHFLVIVRGIFLKGIGLEMLWPHMLGSSRSGSAF